MNKRILLVEDEAGLVLTLTDRLIAEGYQVTHASDGAIGLKLGSTETFDLMILDVMLPRKNGFDLCRDLRQQSITTPIIMLTARTQVVDKVVGLKLGADDYLTKPFEMMELLARIEALLRRVPTTEGQLVHIYQFGDVRIDFRQGQVEKQGQAVELSVREFKLLHYLIEHRGTIISRNELLDEVWGYNAMPSTRTVDVHIAWLRQKLEANPRYPQYILTVHGLGYKFSA